MGSKILSLHESTGTRLTYHLSSSLPLPAVTNKRKISFRGQERWRTFKNSTIYCTRNSNVHKLCYSPRYINGSERSGEEALIDIVEDMYSSINAKNLKKIEGIISDDCCLEDLSFSKPFQGRKEVVKFLRELIDGIGDDVKFVIDRVYPSADDSTVSVTWHLEWRRKYTIPFTRGCSFYECSRVQDRLVIEAIQVMIESPVKPGEFVLVLLKTITYLFNKFPDMAEKFLERPHELVQFLMKIYKIMIEPLILPLVLYYMKLWKFISSFLSMLLITLINILKTLKLLH